MSDETADMLRTTVGDYTLYLINVPGTHMCSKGDLNLPQGIEELAINNTDWGNVTFADMMIRYASTSSEEKHGGVRLT
jgi:hypothetical protein